MAIASTAYRTTPFCHPCTHTSHVWSVFHCSTNDNFSTRVAQFRLRRFNAAISVKQRRINCNNKPRLYVATDGKRNDCAQEAAATAEHPHNAIGGGAVCQQKISTDACRLRQYRHHFACAHERSRTTRLSAPRRQPTGRRRRRPFVPPTTRLRRRINREQRRRQRSSVGQRFNHLKSVPGGLARPGQAHIVGRR